MTQEEKIQILIEQFNKNFETKVKNNDTPLLMTLYENFVKIFKSEEINKRMLKSVADIADKISRGFCTDWKLRQFKEWNELNDEINENAELQAFVYGYCTCMQLNEESKE